MPDRSTVATAGVRGKRRAQSRHAGPSPNASRSREAVQQVEVTPAARVGESFGEQEQQGQLIQQHWCVPIAHVCSPPTDARASRRCACCNRTLSRRWCSSCPASCSSQEHSSGSPSHLWVESVNVRRPSRRTSRTSPAHVFSAFERLRLSSAAVRRTARSAATREEGGIRVDHPVLLLIPAHAAVAGSAVPQGSEHARRRTAFSIPARQRSRGTAASVRDATRAVAVGTVWPGPGLRHNTASSSPLSVTRALADDGAPLRPRCAPR